MKTNANVVAKKDVTKKDGKERSHACIEYIRNSEYRTCFTGMIGALPPGAMHPAFAAPMGFPGAPMLAPMMHPRFR